MLTLEDVLVEFAEASRLGRRNHTDQAAAWADRRWWRSVGRTRRRFSERSGAPWFDRDEEWLRSLPALTPRAPGTSRRDSAWLAALPPLPSWTPGTPAGRD